MLRTGLSRLSGFSTFTGVSTVEDDDPLGASISGMKFDFDRMVLAFERVTFPSSTVDGALPHTHEFLDAMSEVLLLFDHLGSAFAFVRRDISLKTGILRRYAEDSPENFVHLGTAVQAEMDAGVVDLKPPPSAARTLLRLMWALKFIDCLLSYLGAAFDPRSAMPEAERTLRAAVSSAYEEALAEHHSWTIRRTVRAALVFLPTKEVFMGRVCPNENNRQASLKRLATSMTPMTQTMYRFYETHDLLNLQ